MQVGAGKMTQQLKALAHINVWQKDVPTIHLSVEGDKWLYKAVLWPPYVPMAPSCLHTSRAHTYTPCIHNNNTNKYFLKVLSFPVHTYSCCAGYQNLRQHACYLGAVTPGPKLFFKGGGIRHTEKTRKGGMGGRRGEDRRDSVTNHKEPQRKGRVNWVILKQ